MNRKTSRVATARVLRGSSTTGGPVHPRFQISAIERLCERLGAGPESFLIDAVKSGTLFKICSANPGAHSEPLFCRQ